MGEAKRRREAGQKPRIAGRSFDILSQCFRVAEQHEGVTITPPRRCNAMAAAPVVTNPEELM
jgi:hypothetical protein